MGFQTEIGILNDHWHRIKEDPQAFVDYINVTMNSGSRKREYPGLYQVEVQPSHHADDPRVYFSHHNSFTDMGEYGIEDTLAERFGPAEDWVLEHYLKDVDDAIQMLRRSRDYLRYLKEKVPVEERPGGAEFERFGNQHHQRAWKQAHRRRTGIDKVMEELKEERGDD